MKRLARRYVYWQGIDREIEHFVRKCEDCVQTQHNPPAATVHPWQPASDNWERLHLDYAQYGNTHFIILVDVRSKWLEVYPFNHAPTTASTIDCLEKIFSFHRYPIILVTDNATIFTSEEFRSYCAQHGILQRLIAPGHAATNGLAERNVQTFKRRIKSLLSDQRPLTKKLQEILLIYRATPLNCGKSPAELYLNREIRIRLAALRPLQNQANEDQQLTSRTFAEGDRVQSRVYKQSQPWALGVILKKYGTRHYLIRLDNGYIFKRHINQLRRSAVSKRVELNHTN